MGVNIDKNEYYEIKLSNSAYPERGLQSIIFTPAEELVPQLLILYPFPKGEEYVLKLLLPYVVGYGICEKEEFE